jgi:hypothetical protein
MGEINAMDLFIPKGVGLIHMDVFGLPPIPTGSFWQFGSLEVFS